MRQTQKTLALWFFLIILGVFFIQAWQTQRHRSIPDFNYSKFVEAVKANEVATVTFRIDSNEISGDMKPDFEKKYGGTHFVTVGNISDEGFKLVTEHGLTPNYEKGDNAGFVQALVVNWLPLLLIVGMFLFVMRQ